MSDVPELDLTHIEVLSHLRTAEKRADAQRTAWRAGLRAPTVVTAAPTLIFSRRRGPVSSPTPLGVAPEAPSVATQVAPTQVAPRGSAAAVGEPPGSENLPSSLIFLAVVALSFAAVLVFGMAAVASLGLLPPLAAALFGLGGLLVAFGFVTLSATLLLPAWAQGTGRRG